MEGIYDPRIRRETLLRVKKILQKRGQPVHKLDIALHCFKDARQRDFVLLVDQSE